MDLELSAPARRVLGSLLEKERTVPATYPMTLNGVVTACNQTSGRDPIVSYGPGEVTAALAELRAAGLTRVLHASHGARTEKYRQVLDEVLELEDAERAVLTLLLLRGPQTPGELRSRSGRLHAFASLDEVDGALRSLAGRSEPLVEELPRRPGHKEQRWRHLLGGEGEGEDTGAADRVSAGPVAAPEPLVVPDVLAPLAPFAGTWEGAGAGEYPTIEPFAYTQVIELLPVPGKPFLWYRSRTRHATEDRPLHTETGWLRLVGDQQAELVLAQANGILESAEGLVVDGELLLESTVVAGTTTAKEVTATERRYRADGRELTYDIAMAAVGVPLTHHLRAHLHRTS